MHPAYTVRPRSEQEVLDVVRFAIRERLRVRAIGAATPSPRSSRPACNDGSSAASTARLLDAAHQQLGGPIVLVWDNLNTHRSARMTQLVAARPWLTVYPLPPYAPELNPVEGVWAHLQQSLANLAKHRLDQLIGLIKTRLKRMQHRPSLIEGYLAKTGLDFAPPQPQPFKLSSWSGSGAAAGRWSTWSTRRNC